MNWITIPETIKVNLTLLFRLADKIGSTEFDRELLEVMNNIASVEEISGFKFDLGKEPEVLGWCGKRGDTADRVQDYLKDDYKIDPIVTSFPTDISVDRFHARVLNARSIKNSNYRWRYFENPDFKSEVAVVRRSPVGWEVMKCLIAEGNLEQERVQTIAHSATMVFPLARRHVFEDEGNMSMVSRPMADQRLILLLGQRFPILSQREREVCALTILGNSTQTIAEKLNVSINTVMTYRKRAYQRLGVNNVHALTQELI